MKTLEITKATKSLSDYAKEIDREGVIVVRNGKPVAVLSSAKGMDEESIALANNAKFVTVIQKSRARHEAEGGISIDEMRRLVTVRSQKTRRKR